MAGAAVRGRLNWLLADVAGFVDETPNVKTILLEAQGWPGHLPGQHIDIRLTAEDGYQAQRSYSLASPADDSRLEITVERLEDGEVSPYLVDVLQPGDRLELRGPIGGYFVWEPGRGGPLLLLAGGSGVAPLMAMIRARIRVGSDEDMRLLVSSRSWDEAIYRDELERIDQEIDGVEVIHTLTRSRPDGWRGFDRRVDRDMVAEVAWAAHERPLCYVCGPTGFVETVARSLTELGHAPELIRTERFGPTGGSQ
ncbi:MAG: ferredoxin reductase [Acidimicrobiia bacterium]